MAYSYSFASGSDMKGWIESGDFKRLFDSSLPYIESGNYPFADDVSYDQKYEAFETLYLASASDMHFHEYTNYVVASFEDGKLLALYDGFYNPSDTSYNLCRTLYDNDANGSRAYSYKANYVSGWVAKLKELGANKFHSWMPKGSQIAFRLQAKNTLNDLGSIFEETNGGTEVVENTHYYYVRPAYTSIPTEDGLTDDYPAEVQVDFYEEQCKTTLTFK